MDCLYAKATPIITSCVMSELEKLGSRYRIALRIARDERWERLKCDHKGIFPSFLPLSPLLHRFSGRWLILKCVGHYADDCIVDRVLKHRVYIVATNDVDLKRRIRKIPGVPIMSVAKGKYNIERLPDAPER